MYPLVANSQIQPWDKNSTKKKQSEKTLQASCLFMISFSICTSAHFPTFPFTHHSPKKHVSGEAFDFLFSNLLTLRDSSGECTNTNVLKGLLAPWFRDYLDTPKCFRMAQDILQLICLDGVFNVFTHHVYYCTSRSHNKKTSPIHAETYTTIIYNAACMHDQQLKAAVSFSSRIY